MGKVKGQISNSEIAPYLFEATLADTNMGLHSSHIKRISVKRMLNCFRKCSKLTRQAMRNNRGVKCLSINMEIVHGPQNISCDLNSSSKDLNPEYFQPMKSYVYYQLVFT